MRSFKWFGFVFITSFLIGFISAGGEAMAIEQTKYKVIEKQGDLELREYDACIVAETIVEGDFDEVGNEGFRRLFRYISGDNQKKESIPMTAPVAQESTSEKIPMTAPVTQERLGGNWRITFLMPSQYTLETVPEPLDSRVKMKQEPGRLKAAMRYSGTWSRSRYEEKKARLIQWIQDRGWNAVGQPIFARYNSPFRPWFLRRNEVLISVER